ncbi:MAG: DNA repair protein RadC [Cyclobacteriaceae bacterium]
MESNSYNLNILSWAEEDRPREKLLLKGKSALSDAELMAILLGSGTKSLSAVDLAKIILKKANNDLNALASLSINELTSIKGIGSAKAITIVSALELGRRRKDSAWTKKPIIKSSADVYEYMKPEMLDLPIEQFWVLFLNRANMVIKKEHISTGGITGTVADPKVIFKKAMEAHATSMILTHNHPSGQTKPSEFDIRLTKKLKEGGALLDVPIVDHIIFANESYFSFADEGLI